VFNATFNNISVISELMVLIMISLIEDCCNQGSYWTNGA